MTTTIVNLSPSEHEAEAECIRQARECLNSNWEVGRLAAEWTSKYARGRGDADFAELVGCDRATINDSRRVWESFAVICGTYRKLSWSHFRIAVAWEDAEHWLQQAEELELSVADMRKARSLTQPADSHDEPPGAKDNGEPDEPEQKPEPKRRGPRKRKATDPDPPKKKAGKAQPAEANNDEQDEPPDIDGALRLMEATIQRLAEPRDCKTLAKRFRSWADMLDPPKPKADITACQIVVDAWNMIDGVTKCKAITGRRRTHLGARLKDETWDWRAAMEKVRASRFCKGHGEHGWVANFDWFLKPDTAVKLMEGFYDDRTVKTRSQLQNEAAFREVFGGDD